MIHYLVTEELRFRMRWFLIVEPALAERLVTLPYETATTQASLAPGTYIFSDLDQLSPEGRQAAIRLWERLSDLKPDVRLLNDPSRVLGRYELLRALHARGINRFNVFRAPAVLESTQPMRFPVFLRSEREHVGNVSDLLYDWNDVGKAVRKLVAGGEYPVEDLLIVEWCNTSDAAGVFRKYSAFVIGETIVPRHLVCSRDWLVKDYALYDAEHLWEARSYVAENPHATFLQEIARLAGVEYGRFDYAIADGRPQIWEINTNPMVIAPVSVLTPPRFDRIKTDHLSIELHRAPMRRIATALAALDGTSPARGKRRTKLEVKTHLSAREMDSEQWSMLSAGVDARLDPSWLAVMERFVYRAKPLYLALTASSTLRAVAPCLLAFETETGFMSYRPTDALLRPEDVRGRDAPELDRTELEHVAPSLRAERPLLSLSVVVPFTRYAAVSALAWPGEDAAERWVAELDALASRHGAAMWAILGISEQSPMLGFAKTFGLRRALLSADSALSVPSLSIAEYVGALPSHRRNVVRRELRAPAERGYTIAPDPDVGATSASERDRLVESQGARYGGVAGRLPLAELVRAFGEEDVQVIAARRGDRLIGYSLLVSRGNIHHAVGYAADHAAREREDFLWPNLVVYAPIARVAERGGGTLRLGPTNYPAKLLRGARLEPMWGVYRPLRPSLESALDAYLPPFNELQAAHFASFASLMHDGRSTNRNKAPTAVA
jgi:hypothetical protein